MSRDESNSSPALARLLPSAATHTYQRIEVAAPAAATFAAIRTADFTSAAAVRALAAVRMLPDRILRRLRGLPPPPEPAGATIADLIEAGYWVVLDERPGEELALGLVMWDRRVERDGVTRSRFDLPLRGTVRVGWSFTVTPLERDRSLLVTETRAQPVDVHAARRFRRYWHLIAPFAGLTRRLVLRRIRVEAEQRAHVEAPGQGPRQASTLAH